MAKVKNSQCSNGQRGLRLSSILVFISALLCEPASAGENGVPSGKNLFNSPSAALALQTNNLQLPPKGTIRLQTAFEWRSDWQAPISRLHGDLYRLGVLRFDLGIADNVSLQIRGAIRQVLRLNDDSHSSEAAGRSTTANDVGDFSVATVARLTPAGRHRPALGFRIETKLPNTNQDRGIGTNTTDVALSILAAQQYERVLAFAEVGIGILTAPRQINDQNDVLVYGIGLLWMVSKQFQLAGEINGFVSPRQHIPVGTEDRSAARVGLIWRLAKFSLETLAVYGLTRREGKLGIIIGTNWQLNLFSGSPKAQ